MGAIAQIMAAISDDVGASLGAAGFPPLVAGKILVGPASIFEQTSPSRIIFVPTGSTFSMRDIYNRSNAAGAEERKRQNAMRAIPQEAMRFEVRCWASYGSGNAVDS